MKAMRVVVLAVVCLSHVGWGATLDVWTGSLDKTNYQQIGGVTEFQNSGLGVTTTGGSDFLVLSSFTTSTENLSSNIRGRWQVAADYTGGDYSYTEAAAVNGSAIYERWINKAEVSNHEYGSVNINGIYNFGTAGAHSFDIYHRVDFRQNLNTEKGSMVVVGLNAGGTTLRYGTSRQDTTIGSSGGNPYMSATTSSAWSIVGKSATEELASTVDITEKGGKIFIATSMNCNKIDPASVDATKVTGEWQMAVYNSSGVEVERVGSTIQRDVTDGEKDDGAAMLYATTSNLDPGTYTLKLLQKVTGDVGQGIETFNATINAIGLTLQDGAEAGQYFDSFSLEGNDSKSTDDFSKVSEQSFTMNGGLVTAVNYSTTGTGDETTALLKISLENASDVNVYDSQTALRSVGTGGMYGAGGIVGYTNLTAGVYDASLSYSRTSGDATTLTVSDSNLVGFSTQTIPEPATLLILVTGIGGILTVRRFFLI